MKFHIFTSNVLLFGTLAVAQDPSAVLSQFWPTSLPSVAGAQLSSLASELNSVQSSWTGSPQYTSMNAAIFAAAPSSVQASLKTGTWVYAAMATQAWFSTGVPDSAKQAINGEQSALNSVAQKYLGNATTTSIPTSIPTGATTSAVSTSSSHAAGPRPTVIQAAALGFVGVVGVMAAL